jgi:hypothetical protein
MADMMILHSPVEMGIFSFSFLPLFLVLSTCMLMRHGVDGFSPSSWEPQEEGMISTAASFSLSKKPRFVSPGKSQTPEGDAR